MSENGGKTTLYIIQSPDNERPDCSAADVITEAGSKGLLPLFATEAGKPSPDGFGNCHEVAAALSTDLVLCGMDGGWRYFLGHVQPGERSSFLHSWLEFDGWVVDAGGTVIRVTDAAFFREHLRADVLMEGPVRDWLTIQQDAGLHGTED